MRLLLINFEYPPLGGGGGIATRQVAEELAKRHTVHVLTTRFNGLPAVESVAGVVIHRVSVLGRRSRSVATLVSLVTFVPAALWRGARLCRQQRFEVVNAQFVVPSGIVGWWLSWWFGIPFVLSFIGGDIYDPSKGISPHRNWLLRDLIRYLARQAASRTAISHDVARRARELHGVREPITVVPLGIKPAVVPPASRAELGWSEGELIFVSIGRLIPRKGFDDLVRVWRDIPAARLIIVGEGPQHRLLAGLISKLKLGERVQLLGFVDETKKQQILRVADAYVSAAEHEGFGIVFLEAMEAGLPIVATNSGGQTDFLVPGDNAILVPPCQPAELRAAVERLLNDDELRQTLGQNNRRKVSQYYLERTAARFERVLLQYAGGA